mgnify:CR=1 FL=1
MNLGLIKTKTLTSYLRLVHSLTLLHPRPFTQTILSTIDNEFAHADAMNDTISEDVLVFCNGEDIHLHSVVFKLTAAMVAQPSQMCCIH